MFRGPGAREIRIREAAGAFRVIYVAKLDSTIYVLHCFQKKTRATRKSDPPAKQVLGIHQHRPENERRHSRRHVDKQIDITIRAGIVASHGSEHLQVPQSMPHGQGPQLMAVLLD